MSLQLEPVVLEGRHARLEPLARDHAAGLAEAVQDGELWRLWYTAIPHPEKVPAEIERRLGEQAQGRMLPFAVRQAGSGRLVGMTTYLHIEPAHRRLEIGATWYAASVQRTPLNTECKRLLLGHAFDTLGCVAVEFRTHHMNHTSRRAIERLGAKLDGVLRSHQTLADGTLRDTAVYSIIATEWPTVKRHLEWQLERPH
ncbi:GNAT family N-acetyltransferase [Eleftheria terrae]|uniref:GNAT family N-acetyltransferase n=1 Tax=Eleftheria terrae TaxID=1597781 RepID=UPI00263AAB41|nr:GNAT family protein [Eleftheria terrae]WKB52209.1 GNAT family N-acetyltransferase [Eleftheria terrae]